MSLLSHLGFLEFKAYAGADNAVVVQTGTFWNVATRNKAHATVMHQTQRIDTTCPMGGDACSCMRGALNEEIAAIAAIAASDEQTDE